MANLKYVEKIKFDECDDDHRTYYRFDLDDGKNFCYRTRMSFNAFFHSIKDRNVSNGFLYHTDRKDSIEKIAKIFDDYPVNWIDCKNIWEFYQIIGYDYKTKKYLNN